MPARTATKRRAVPDVIPVKKPTLPQQAQVQVKRK